MALLGTANHCNRLKSYLYAMGKHQESLAYYREALDGKRLEFGNEHPAMPGAMEGMANALRTLDRFEEALPLYLELLERKGDPQEKYKRRAMRSISKMGAALATQGRYAEAETVLLRTYETLESSLGLDDPRTQKLIQSLVDLYTSWHNAEPDAGYDTRVGEWREKLDVQRGDNVPSLEQSKPGE